jgi:hypothetical protein
MAGEVLKFPAMGTRPVPPPSLRNAPTFETFDVDASKRLLGLIHEELEKSEQLLEPWRPILEQLVRAARDLPFEAIPQPRAHLSRRPMEALHEAVHDATGNKLTLKLCAATDTSTGTTCSKIAQTLTATDSMLAGGSVGVLISTGTGSTQQYRVDKFAAQLQ